MVGYIEGVSNGFLKTRGGGLYANEQLLTHDNLLTSNC